MRQRPRPFRRRSTRLWLGVIVSLCLLLNQWALAAYACPTEQATLPCHAHVDAKHPGLCHQHCHPLTLSSLDGKAPTVPPAVLPPSLPPLGGQVAAAAGSVQCELPAAQWATPPPLVRFCRFLI